VTSRKGREAVRAELPKETKEALKASEKPMWKVIDEAVRMSLGVGDANTEAAFRRRIEQLEQERSDVQTQIGALNKELATIEQRLEDEQSRLEQYLEEQESIQDIQDRILSELETSSMSVFRWKSELRDLARREYGHETDANIQKAISDLKTRRDELGLEIPESQFSENVASSRTAVADGDPQFKAVRGDNG
jgi:chromosome segregation ATPase